MPSQKGSILQFNQYTNSDKMPYVIYTGLESLIEKTDGWANNPEKSWTTKIGEDIPYRYPISTIWTFNNIEHKHTL